VFDDWLHGLQDDVHRWSDESGSKVSLVGWSLGGIYARELAKRCPDRVRQVITLGTPFASMRGATHAEGVYRLLNGSNDQLTPIVGLFGAIAGYLLGRDSRQPKDE
jgi:pimeloyl-ACP methyl ester carboxylesterase